MIRMEERSCLINLQGYVESSTIAKHYSLAPQAMRGPCHSLYKRGILEKKEV